MTDWTAVDLFSGIGGFALGLERAGVQTVAFCDNNPKCIHLLRHHWPDALFFDDVSTMSAADVSCRPRVISGGFPCQDVSLAGPGGGLEGARSGLWREYARLIRDLRPDYVIVENVSALLGRGFGDVLGDLAALGFDAWWDCIPASAIGAPHRRDRVWLVAYPRGVQHEGFGDAFRGKIAAGLHEACLANSSRPMRDGGWPIAEEGGRSESADRGETLADSISDDVEGLIASLADPEEWGGQVGGPPGSRRDGLGWWSVEPDVGRVANGVPARVDRLHGLGNAIVPQIAEIIARAIIACAPASASDASTTDKG